MCFATCLLCQLRSKPLTRHILRNTGVSDVDVHGVEIKNARIR